jgi:transcriptional regulator with XRE-family HTH domain
MLRLTRLRHRRGLSQRQVAERLKIGFWTYAKTERGAYVPGADSPLAHKLERYYCYRLKTLLADC